MRYLVITDVHGNGDALRTVLSASESLGYDEVLMLGDLVGYGAEPNEVIDLIVGLSAPCHVIRGNHDKVIAGVDDGETFNSVALLAARWTTERLTPDNLTYLRALPQGPREIAGGLVICHGSPLDEDEYVLSSDQTTMIFEHTVSSPIFFGHTHVPTLALAHSLQIDVPTADLVVRLEPEHRYLVNPGSVGQPRDRDPRAAFMIYDVEEAHLEWHRTDYPVAQAQERIYAAGLPAILAHRLGLGI